MRFYTLFVVFLLVSSNCFAVDLQCASAAIAQAKKLLSFHSDADNRAEVESNAKKLPSISNPTNKNQKFIVLEVMGYVYKGTYRMRFIYYPMGKECVLMGQEVLELASL